MNSGFIQSLIFWANEEHTLKHWEILRRAFEVAVFMHCKSLDKDIIETKVHWEEPNSFKGFEFYDSHQSVTVVYDDAQQIEINTNLNSLQATINDLERWIKP